MRLPAPALESLVRARIGELLADPAQLATALVAETGCQIVVSSTWRRIPRCRDILRYYGFRGSFARDWRTDWLRSLEQPDLVLGDEIEDWLARNGRPPFAIVDDDSDMLLEQMPRFVQTTFERELTGAHVERLISLLLPHLTK